MAGLSPFRSIQFAQSSLLQRTLCSSLWTNVLLQGIARTCGPGQKRRTGQRSLLHRTQDEPALLFLVGLGGLREECAGQIVPFSHLCDDAGSRQG